MSVAVLGSGAFGTALAVSLAQVGPVTLWARDPEQAKRIGSTRQNEARLPGVRLPDEIAVTADLQIAAQNDVLLLAIPAQSLAAFAQAQAALLAGSVLVACCKGIDVETGLGPLAMLAAALPDADCAILTGPSFAADIARGLPTALTLAASREHVAISLQQRLSTPNLRLYRSDDPLGAELGGALKNVIAIACGAVIGAGLGDSARAAVMTRGFAEISRAAVQMGARQSTLMGLSGLGDLTLTCTSDQSRNYRLGVALGEGRAFDPNVTVEGASTARALRRVAGRGGLDLPICATVADLVDGSITVRDAAEDLFARPLRPE